MKKTGKKEQPRKQVAPRIVAKDSSAKKVTAPAVLQKALAAANIAQKLKMSAISKSQEENSVDKASKKAVPAKHAKQDDGKKVSPNKGAKPASHVSAAGGSAPAKTEAITTMVSSKKQKKRKHGVDEGLASAPSPSNVAEQPTKEPAAKKMKVDSDQKKVLAPATTLEQKAEPILTDRTPKVSKVTAAQKSILGKLLSKSKLISANGLNAVPNPLSVKPLGGAKPKAPSVGSKPIAPAVGAKPKAPAVVAKPKDVKTKIQKSHIEGGKEAKQSKQVASATPSAGSAVASDGLTETQKKMLNKLSGGRFRMINEQLYTTSSVDAFKKFSKDPRMFDIYHEGFRAQVESWPMNPVDYYINQLKPMKPVSKSSPLVIADMGCGEAALAVALKGDASKRVHSFDLVSPNAHVVACDMRKVPLEAGICDVVVFSLSLMGTNFLEFLTEAHRIMKANGKLKIAEVVSRVTDVDRFIAAVSALGFKFLSKENSSKMFIFLDFSKEAKPVKKPSEVASDQPLLKPCLYKKR